MNTAQHPVTLREFLNVRGTVTPQLVAGPTPSPDKGRLLWCLLQEGSIAAPRQQPLSAQPQGHAAADTKFSFKKIHWSGPGLGSWEGFHQPQTGIGFHTIFQVIFMYSPEEDALQHADTQAMKEIK